MKTLLFVSALLIFSEEIILKTDCARLNLKARVKSVYEYVDFVQQNSAESRLANCDLEYEFNENGNLLVGRMLLPKSHTVCSQTYFSYNGQGNNIGHTVVNVSGMVTDSSITQYTFDKHNRISEKRTIGANQYENELYAYDSLERLIQITGYLSDGNLFEKKLFYYNAYGLVRSDWIDSARHSTIRNVYADNGSENLLEQWVSDDGKVFMKQYVYKYDSHNNLIEEEALPGSVYKWGMKKNKAYDKNGNIISERYLAFTSNGKVTNNTKFKYQYDAAGNWVEQKKYFDGKLVKILKRRITYY